MGIEAIFSTTEVAAKLSELGFSNVFDLGDVSVAREHEDIPKASGEHTGKCKPECVIRRPHGHHGRGRRPRPNGESQGALGMEHEHHRSRHGRSKGKKFGDSSSSDSTEAVLTSFAKYFGITFGSFVLVAMLYCMYQKHYRKRHVVLPEEPEIKAIPEGSGEGSFVVSVNDPQTGSPIETINGSPEGFGETTEPTELPPSFEEVYKHTQDAKKHAVLTE